MKVQGEGQLLRVFVGESDRWEGRPLYEAIVRAAREQGLAGVTALRGIEGYGASGRIHTVKILRLSEDLPIVVEIVDRAERIAAFLPTLDSMVSEGMVTLEKVNILLYRHDSAPSQTRQTDDELQLEAPPDPSPAAPSGVVPTTERAQAILEAARESAAGARRVFVDSVDVLLAMLCDADGIAGRAFSELGMDVETVQRSLREEVSRDERSDAYLVTLTAKSLAEAKWLGRTDADAEHLLLAVCELRPSAATDVLMRLGVQPREICKTVLGIVGRGDDWRRWLADRPDM